jgi:hypothetical protein
VEHRGIILCVLALDASACMRTNTELQTLPPFAREAVVAGDETASVIAMDLALEDGVARGHLRWASSCRRVVLVHERAQEVTRKKPDYGAAVLSGVFGIGAGVLGGLLLSRSNEFSDEVTCEESDEGTEECSSPRDTAIGLGITLAGGGIALTTSAVVTAATPQSRAYRDVDEATREERVLAENVSCGNGPVAWLEVALYGEGERLAASTTDADGNVAFDVPRELTGTVSLVANGMFSRYGVIEPGQKLAEVVLEPAESPSSQ